MSCGLAALSVSTPARASHCSLPLVPWKVVFFHGGAAWVSGRESVLASYDTVHRVSFGGGQAAPTRTTNRKLVTAAFPVNVNRRRVRVVSAPGVALVAASRSCQ